VNVRSSIIASIIDPATAASARTNNENINSREQKDQATGEEEEDIERDLRGQMKSQRLSEGSSKRRIEGGVDLSSSSARPQDLRLSEHLLEGGGGSAASSPLSSPASRGSAPPLSGLSREKSSHSMNSLGTDSSAGSSAMGVLSKYSPSCYMTLLAEGPVAPPLPLSAERDFQRVMGSIQSDLTNKDDWQVRMSALTRLQGVGKGMNGSPGSVTPEQLVTFLRSTIHEVVRIDGLYVCLLYLCCHLIHTLRRFQTKLLTSDQ
jgi:hypothetical protein